MEGCCKGVAVWDACCVGEALIQLYSLPSSLLSRLELISFARGTVVINKQNQASASSNPHLPQCRVVGEGRNYTFFFECWVKCRSFHLKLDIFEFD